MMKVYQDEDNVSTDLDRLFTTKPIIPISRSGSAKKGATYVDISNRTYTVQSRDKSIPVNVETTAPTMLLFGLLKKDSKWPNVRTEAIIPLKTEVSPC